MSMRQALALLRPLLRAIQWAPAAIAGLLAPAIIGLAVSSTGTGSRELIMALRTVAVILCIGAVFSLDDPAASSTAATPTSLLRRRLLRVALAMTVVAIPWGGSLWLVAHWNPPRGEKPPLTTISLEMLTLLGLTLAFAAVVARITGLDSPGSATASLLLVLVAASLLLPPTWSPWLSPGQAAPFGQRHQWWAVAFLLSQVCFLWATREPYWRVRLRLNHNA